MHTAGYHWTRLLDSFLESLSAFQRTLSLRENARKRVIWVIACNQAGKTTLLSALNRYPQCTLYRENSPHAYQQYRILPDHTIKRLIELTDDERVVFELANDLQYTDRYLNLYPDSQALWIFRHYRAVVRDIVGKWGEAQKDMLIGIVTGTVRHPGQHSVAEQLSPQTRVLLERHVSDAMSAEDGAALLWYLRNQMYFQLHLDRDERVMLVKHDDLVADPERCVKGIFDFIQIKYARRYVRNIRRSSPDLDPLPGLNPEIEALCEDMLDCMNSAYSRQRQDRR